MEKLINEFSVGLFVWQTLIFVLLLILLRKYAWKPILNAVNEREEGIKDALASAEEAKKEMQNLQADNLTLLKEARAERDGMLKDARDIKNNMIEEAKGEAKIQADKMIASAKAVIQSEQQAAVADIKNQVANLSIDIAKKVVGEELSSKEKQLELVAKLLKEVSIN